MAICGVDLGNLSMLISQTSKGGVDVILNDSSNRQTATCVSVQGKQRFIGDSGAALARSNVNNTITNMKLLVGRKFHEADVQLEISKCPYKCVEMAHGGVGVSVMYNDEQIVLSAEHMVAVLMKLSCDITKSANNGVALVDAVIAVPYWFTDLQRRALMAAAEIAGYHLLKIVNETTAIALGYGIYKSAKGLFHATDAMNVMFIDMGYTGYQVSIVSFIQEGMKVLSTHCNARLGGRDVDQLIISYLIDKFKASSKIDVSDNKKAILKLTAVAEKAKKTLSPHGVTEASCSVECLAEERDLSCILKRDELESRLGPMMAQLEKPIADCLAEAGLEASQLAEVEITGGCTRVNLIKKTLSEILKLDATAMNYGLKTTMNADEAVVRGLALQCAIESSRIKVKPFNITDRVAYSMNATFDNNNEASDEDLVEIYTRGDELPRKPKRLTFRRKDTNDFTVYITYADSAFEFLPTGTDRNVAKFVIRMPNPYPVEPGMESNVNEPHDVRVTFNLDKNGCIFISKAELMVEIPNVEKPESKEEKKEEEKKEEGKEAEEKKESEEAPAAAKRKFKKVDLVVDVNIEGLLTKQQIKDACELEASMAFEDQLIKETADKRNDLESYIYAARSKVDGPLKNFGSPDDISKFKADVDAAEDWLYGDGYEATKNQYIKKLDELLVQGKAMESRVWEENNRPGALTQLKTQIEGCRNFCGLTDEAHEHITDDERATIRSECDAAEGWMFDMQGKQGDMKSYENPVLTVALINTTRQTLFNKTNGIMTKPKPKPVVVTPPPNETPAAAASADEAQGDAPMDEASTEGAPERDVGSEAAPEAAAEAEPMDVDESKQADVTSEEKNVD